MPRDRKAQLFTLDLLLALVPLTLLLGISANALSGTMVQIQDYYESYSMQRRVNDALDVLIRTPGEPAQWNSSVSPTTLGLAFYDTSANRSLSHIIDENKFAILNVSLLEGFLGTPYPYVNLSMVDLQNGTLALNRCNGSYEDVSRVYSAERNILYYLLRIEEEVHQIAHGDKEESERCCSTCKANQYIYEVPFDVATDDLSNFEFWLGYASDGDVTAEYTLKTAPIDCCTKCANLGSPKQSLFPSSFGKPTKEWGSRKISDDFTISLGTNYLYIRATGSPNANGADFYVIKAPVNTSQSEITEDLTLNEPRMMRIVLEVGR
jgi:hypothetical protein